MATKKETLENAFVAQIAAQVSAFNGNVAPVAAAQMAPLSQTTPRAEVIWAATETIDITQSVGARVRIWERLTFRVFIFAGDSGKTPGSARLGTGGCYDLAQQVRAALIGFEPVITSVETIFPVVPVKGRSEMPIQVEAGLFAMSNDFDVDLIYLEGQG